MVEQWECYSLLQDSSNFHYSCGLIPTRRDCWRQLRIVAEIWGPHAENLYSSAFFQRSLLNSWKSTDETGHPWAPMDVFRTNPDVPGLPQTSPDKCKHPWMSGLKLRCPIIFIETQPNNGNRNAIKRNRVPKPFVGIWCSTANRDLTHFASSL